MICGLPELSNSFHFEAQISIFWPVILHSYPTMNFTDLDQGIKMIILESNLATFEASFIFWGSWGSSKNWLKMAKFSLHKFVKYTLLSFKFWRKNTMVLMRFYCSGVQICFENYEIVLLYSTDILISKSMLRP